VVELFMTQTGQIRPNLTIIDSPVSSKHSFETRTGPAGRPGTRAWDRSGFKQKPAWELAWQNPADPGKPG